MAGIYIPNMQMPKSCYDCALQDDECFGSIKCCYAKTWGSANMRAVDCPLVFVPDHGRLIDADALKYTDNFIHKTMLFGGQVVYAQDEIDNAPTIIPADGKDGAE